MSDAFRFDASTEALLAGVGLVSELPDIRRRRREDDADVVGAIDAWTARRAAFGQALDEAEARGVTMRLSTLARSFSLDDEAIDLVLLAVAPMVDPEFLDRVGRAHETLFFRGVDLDLMLSLRFHTPAQQLRGRRHFAPEAPLISNGLLSLAPLESRLNPHEVEVRPTDALAGFLLERPPVAGLLARFCEIASPALEWEQVVLPLEQKSLVWDVVSGEALVQPQLEAWGYGRVAPRGRGLVLLFAGPPGTGKTAFAHALASRLGRRLLVVRTSRLVAVRDPIQPVLADVFRIASLERAVVLLDDCEALMSTRDARLLALLEALEDNEGLVLLTTNLAPEIDFAMNRRIHLRVDFEPPSALLREQIWEAHLPPEAPLSDDIDVRLLAASYEFTGGTIRNAVMVALSRMAARGAERLTMQDLRDAAGTQLGARFDGLALKTTVQIGLDRLVLPDTEMAQLRDVLDACRCHDHVMTRWGFGKKLPTGRGICVLFDGPPGTGKTFTAEIMASELNLPLYRIHIPNIVSKWVGETERNITEIFVRARAARAILLFDEADSLFSRRTANPQSSNDRYSNMEVNLLLQEIERYDGVTILTTNLFGNLDEALQRRLQFRLTFPFPEAVERARIWESMMPGDAPVAPDVDYAALGRRFEIAGGHIKNALLKAAYRAKRDNLSIGQAHLVEASLAECRAQGKLVRATAIAAAPVVTVVPSAPGELNEG